MHTIIGSSNNENEMQRAIRVSTLPVINNEQISYITLEIL